MRKMIFRNGIMSLINNNLNRLLKINHALSTQSVLCKYPNFVHVRNWSTTTESMQRQQNQKLRLTAQEINYTQIGNGPHVIVCIPGGLGYIEVDFGPQLEKLNRDKFTIVAVDPPGYGKSRPPNRDYSGDFFKRDAHTVAEVMETLGHKTFSILGWSAGGMVGMILAADFPDRVRKLIAWGCAAFMDDTTVNIYRQMTLQRLTPEMKAPLLKIYGEKYFEEILNGVIDAFNRFHQNGGDMGHTSRLKDIKCPTLIVNGDLDPLTGVYHAEYLQKNIMNSELVIFPNGKHNIHLRYPSQFNSLVENFLEKNNLQLILNNTTDNN